MENTKNGIARKKDSYAQIVAIIALEEIGTDPWGCRKYDAVMKSVRIYCLGQKQVGYKTSSLRGLYWTAPYLHNHSVAVGPNGELGIGQTLYRNMAPDPYESLRALIDRELRQKISIQTETDLRSGLIQNYRPDEPAILPNGHEYWVDNHYGYTEQDQEDLIYFIMALDDQPATYLPQTAENLPFNFPRDDMLNKIQNE